MPTKLLVIAPHEASYTDPLEVQAGEALILNGRKDLWDGHVWLWARSCRDGREGWLPDCLLVNVDANQATCNSDYSAMELTCSEGHCVTRLNAMHGWTLCLAENGKRGWVPDRCLKPL